MINQYVIPNAKITPAAPLQLPSSSAEQAKLPKQPELHVVFFIFHNGIVLMGCHYICFYISYIHKSLYFYLTYTFSLWLSTLLHNK